MKARVKATGEIIEVSQGIYSPYQYVGDNGAIYTDEDIEILQEVLDSTIDYWTRLEHQYAGMVMQGILSSGSIMERIAKFKVEDLPSLVAKLSTQCAHALVEKYKEKEE